jgi:hypothetical protein
LGKVQANTFDQLIAEIAALPDEWHRAGSVPRPVLRAIARHALNAGPLKSSVETGTGRTTLLLSHLSEKHTVFTKDDLGDGDSLVAVRRSPLLREDRVTFVVGPTQRTLPTHSFTEDIDLAYLDGPHAYPFLDLEYWAVYPHLRPGGLLIIDDIQIPTTNNLYRFLRADRMWSALEVVDDTAFFARTVAPAIDPFGEGWWLQGMNQRTATGHRTARHRLRDNVEDVKRTARARVALRTRLAHLLGRSRPSSSRDDRPPHTP